MTEAKNVTEEQVLDALRQVNDPELGLNIVDMGLIYAVVIEDGKVDVDMTLTTPGCPMHSFIARQAWAAVNNVAGVTEASVRIVWEPRWTPDRLSLAARAQLGWN
jgi:metal-sulfur cluster biosynthetic enzyme